jgi:ABC-2 type transport system permease protein
VKEIIRAAYVIGRRDFHAIIFSKAFIFFLIGPLFPLLVGGLAGSLGGAVAKDIDRPVLGIALRADEAEKLTTARMFLTKELGEDSFPEFRTLPSPAAGVKLDAKALLADKKAGLAGILGGTLQNPELTGTAGQVGRWKGKIALLAGHALSGQAINLPAVKTDIVNKSAGGAKQQRVLTAQLAQVLLFMLTMLLAGMVLSNLVEEKSNKIIEILAASIPMESVFLGKLFAMLAMAFIGIIVWTGPTQPAYTCCGLADIPDAGRRLLCDGLSDVRVAFPWYWRTGWNRSRSTNAVNASDHGANAGVLFYLLYRW